MRNRAAEGLLLALMICGGIFLGRELWTWGVLALGGAAFLHYRRARLETLPGTSRPGPSEEEIPAFVKEEVVEGVTDTTHRSLTPEYKRKIRLEIEEVILNSLNALLDLLQGAVPFHTAAIFRRGRTDLLYLFLYRSESKQIALGETIDYGAGLVGQIMREKEGRLISEGDIRSPSTTLLYYKTDEGIRSFIGAPITVEGVCRGAVVVDAKKQFAFSDAHKARVVQFAKTAGLLQYFAYLQLENRIDRNKVTALSSFQRKFFKLESEEAILSLLGEVLQTLMPSARMSVSLLAEKKGHAKIHFAAGAESDYFNGFTYPFNEKGLVSLVFEKNAMINRKFEPGRYVPRFSVREKVNPEIKSILGVPIPDTNGEGCIGVIALESYQANHFTQVDMENVQNLAHSTGLALDKIKMLNTQTHLATVDGLTVLPNHRMFQNSLEERFKRVRRQNAQLAIILTDIDHFKSVNDTYGHPVGDLILKSVAEILRGSVRKDVDLAARYGGEEFACLLESGVDMAMETAERIRAQVEKTPFDIGAGRQLKITMSFGVAVFPLDASKKQDLIERADKALYAAKKGGRNQVKKW